MKRRFNERDKELLRKAMEMIGDNQATALILRYWKNYYIEEVAQEMKLSWAQANKLIEQAQDEIKKILLKYKDFKGGPRVDTGRIDKAKEKYLELLQKSGMVERLF